MLTVNGAVVLCEGGATLAGTFVLYPPAPPPPEHPPPPAATTRYSTVSPK